MASIIRIKRSGSTGSPSALAQGEVAYSYLAGTQANGGDRLYIGTGTENANNEAANIEVVGGKYFTDMLDHVHGTLTASSAIITDSSNKIDVLNVDNITINGNEISSTNINGNITLNPNGTGLIDASTTRIINVADPTSTQDAATKKYVDDQVIAASNSNFTITGDTGSDVLPSGSTINFTGNTGISTTVTDQQVDIDLDDTVVTPGSYGSSTQIATFTVDQQGRLTAAGNQTISTDLLISGDSGTDTVPSSDTLDFAGGTGITTTVSNNQVSFVLDDTAVGAGSYGSSTEIATFTVDQQGRLTAAGTATISTDLLISGDSGTDSVPSSNTLNFAGGSNITSTVSNNDVNFALDSDVSGLTSLAVDNITIDGNAITSTDTDGDITLTPDGTGSVVISSDLIVQGNTVTVNSNEVNIGNY